MDGGNKLLQPVARRDEGYHLPSRQRLVAAAKVASVAEHIHGMLEDISRYPLDVAAFLTLLVMQVALLVLVLRLGVGADRTIPLLHLLDGRPRAHADDPYRNGLQASLMFA